MTVVSGTTPLNYLVSIEVISILQALFGRLHAPPAVIRELGHPKSPEAVRLRAGSPPDWLVVQAPTRLDPDLKLGPGETEAILLAHELRADLLLIDERKGYRVARARGLKVVSTLAILEEASSRKLIDFDAVIERLDRETSFHVTEEVLGDSRRRGEGRSAREGGDAADPSPGSTPTD